MRPTASYFLSDGASSINHGQWLLGLFEPPAFLTIRTFMKRQAYLDGVSSMIHGHQLAGFALVVAFWTTMIFFMIEPLCC